MREILFRGKIKVCDEWVYGFPFISRKGECKIKWYDGYYGSSKTSEIYTESIGQFTGLTDKNGKKIFEGDIVEGHCHSQWRHELQRCEIAYDRDGFEARHHVRCGEETRYYTYKVLFSKDVVVIGNIYDNPELLEVKENEK